MLGRWGSWTAYQFDAAVTMIGHAIENASQEQEKVGPEDDPKWQHKYSMEQLLDPKFRLPLQNGDADDFDVLNFAGMADVIVDEVA